MHLDKFHINRRFIGNVLLAVFFVMIFAAESRASAIASSQARAQASGQAAANLGAGGPGSDLRAIASLRPPQQQQQTFTGFPAGTLPGSTMGGADGGPVDKVVMTMPGDSSLPPLSPVIGPEMAGSKLDRLSVIANHLGYNIVRMSYSPTVLDTPYTFALMNGNRRIATLYFNHSMTLVMVQ